MSKKLELEQMIKIDRQIEKLELYEFLEIVKTVFSEQYEVDSEGQITLYVKPGELNKPNSSYFTLTKEPSISNNNYTKKYSDKVYSKSVLAITYYTHEERDSSIFYIKEICEDEKISIFKPNFKYISRVVTLNTTKFEKLFYEYEAITKRKTLESILKQKTSTKKGALKI
ncbi:hypothetical protein [Achromobacter xylosoxidans]|uniref:hypothetical protein n=1 Tax=Alcaligenes xylosoxydans xylosoxydans TaxID=85698 RepID=UPI000AE20E56|nr:hypothetical protein [Achromobacter xylosoxidans]